MLFNSFDYLLFLTFALVGYWALRRARMARLIFVLVASCAFYATSSPWYLGLIFFSTTVDWAVGHQISRSDDDTIRKRWVAVSVVVNLSLLGFFKYWDFGAQAVSDGLNLLHVQVHAPLLHLMLPVGISFYTFESLSYCIDVYRRKCEPARNPLELLFFITFFPKLVAGPIARPADLLPQLRREPSVSPDRISEGLFLILTGMTKKVIFADYVSINLVDRVFEAPDRFTSIEVLVALYGFTLQIYADFSGYTDIARGSAKLFGISLPENFDRPYQSKSPAEFWRRWHMSLSTWLRDYLYFPLGGSRHGEARTYFNLWLTIFLIGLWHGASWTFVIYGALQATAVALHRLVTRWRGVDTTNDARWLTALKVFGTLQFAVFTRILFRAEDLENAGDIVEQMGRGSWGAANVAPTLWLILVLGFAAHYTPRAWYAQARHHFMRMPAPAQGGVLAAGLGLLMLVANGQTVPYIYFQF